MDFAHIILSIWRCFALKWKIGFQTNGEMDILRWS
ncbi:hypothetical protein KPNJ1_00056 [Klebsiella pneumoniae 30660/NJST258_1]|uniref:Uncharacterized protein n=2 Tax=Enterobacteriaceae TaxID=543 RepID=W8USC3_KLEPN|nr:hypothetical protein KPNJ2_00057 [Klebsiella pneumoniae 30684/NJST258_2]AHM82462.1 hypothetical protein KPNJ1_00056 [Klebsiella pneumoniae 30660/NJST258_1]